MAYKIQLRHDIESNWIEYNPVLMDGEMGLITDKLGRYKVGDGIHSWNELPMLPMGSSSKTSFYLVNNVLSLTEDSLSEDISSAIGGFDSLKDAVMAGYAVCDFVSSDGNVTVIPAVSAGVVSEDTVDMYFSDGYSLRHVRVLSVESEDGTSLSITLGSVVLQGAGAPGLSTTDKTVVGGINEILAGLNRVYPEVFPLSVALSGGGIYKKGTSQKITLSWTVKEGNTEVTPLSLELNGAGIPVTQKTTSFDNVTVDTTYTLTVTNAFETASKSVSARFVNPNYFGAVDADFVPTEDGIKGLTELVRGSRGYTSTSNLDNQKLLYAYPKSFGALTSIKDANNFEYLGSYTRSEMQVNGEVYYVYLLTDPVSITLFKQIYA